MFKVMAIVVVAIGVAVLLNHVIVEVKTTIRWVCAAIFLALALAPLVDLVAAGPHPRPPPAALARDPGRLRPLRRRLHPPRARGDPADRARGRVSSARSCRPTSRTSRPGRTTTTQFRELNDKYDITQLLSQEASQLPAKLGDAAGAAKEVTVGILNNIVEAVIVLTLAFFLLLDGGQQFFSAHRAPARAAARPRPPGRRPDRGDRPLLRLGQPAARGARRRLHLARRSSCSGSSSRCRSRSWSPSSTSCR